MKKLLTVLLIIGVLDKCAYAEDWPTIAYKDSDGVHFISINPTAQTTVEIEIQKSTGKPVLAFIPVQPSDIPKEKPENLDIQFGRLVVDPVKKQADLDKQAAKQADQDAVLQKLKITRQEAQKLKDLFS